jgi:lipopolysaccharide heptosyltransferase I
MNRILLVRLGALGDVVHAIPVAAALRRAFPAARLDWLVSDKHRPILDLVPILDRRLTIDGGTSSGGASWWRAVRALRDARYDVAIDLQGLVKSAALARSSGAARVVGFAASYLRERLARPLYTEVYDPGCHGIYDANETRHVVEINLGLLKPLGISTLVPEFPIEPVTSAVASDVVDRTGGRYALLNPGAQWPNKRWPPSRLGRVAAALRARHGLSSVALWGNDERELADAVAADSGGAAFASPRASIADLVALARGAAVMVSGDTGPMHIAAAVGTPIVGLFGPTRPSRNGPWSPRDVTVSRAEVCRCHHLRRCEAARMCLLDIEVDEIVAAVDRRLAADSRGV